VATAARNLSELGYLDVSDKALTGERTPALDQATRSVHKEQNRNNNANLSEDAAYGPQTQAAVIPALRRLRDMQAAGLKPSMPAPQSVAKPEVPVAPNDLIAYALGEVSKPWLQSGPSAPDIGGSVQTASLATGETNAGLHGAPLVSEVRPNDLGYAPVEPVDPGVEVAIAPAAVLGALALAARAAAPTVVPPGKELLKRLPTILSRKGKYADEDTVFIPPVITSENLDNCWPGKWYPNGPIRFCGYIRTEELPGGDVEFVPEGEIYFRCRQERPEDMKLARKIMRALNKVMSNKNLGHTYAPAFPPPRPTEKGYPVWVGHEARAWARAAPNRLHMTYRGPREGTLAGLRPLD